MKKRGKYSFLLLVLLLNINVLVQISLSHAESSSQNNSSKLTFKKIVFHGESNERFGLPSEVGDVNDDGTIDVRDAILCINHILGELLPGPYYRWLWTSDCNGPPGNCSGDGITDCLDAIKIVNLILELDECP